MNDVKAIGRLARALEELEVEDRRRVLGLFGETKAAPGALASAATKLANVFEVLDAAGRARVLAFFSAQLEPMPAPSSTGAPAE